MPRPYAAARAALASAAAVNPYRLSDAVIPRMYRHYLKRPTVSAAAATMRENGGPWPDAVRRRAAAAGPGSLPPLTR